MRNLVRRSSSLGRACFHVSLIPKYRHNIFGYGRIKEFCEQVFREISNQYGFAILDIGFDIDHVHVTLDIGNKLSVARTMQLLKGISSRKLSKAFPWLKTRYFWKGNLWSGACYYDSLGINYEVMKSYVVNQGKKGDTQRQQLLSAFMPPTSVGGG